MRYPLYTPNALKTSMYRAFENGVVLVIDYTNTTPEASCGFSRNGFVKLHVGMRGVLEA